MMLPRQIDPRKLVAQGATLHGEAPAAEMTRLMSVVLNSDRAARATLSFFRDEGGNAVANGTFSLSVDLQCQRCLGPVTRNLSTESRLGIVWNDEQAGKLPRPLEPWVVGGQNSDLFVLVEEELLLALPIVALHDEAECPGTGRFSTGEFGDGEGGAPDNPFRVLKNLKR